MKTDTPLNLLARGWKIDAGKPAHYYGVSEEFFESFERRYLKKELPQSKAEMLMFSGFSKEDLFTMQPKEISELIDTGNVTGNDISMMRNQVYQRAKDFGDKIPGDWKPRQIKKKKAKEENSKEEIEEEEPEEKELYEIVFESFTDKHVPGITLTTIAEYLRDAQADLHEIETAREDLYQTLSNMKLKQDDISRIVEELAKAERKNVAETLSNKIKGQLSKLESDRYVDQIRKSFVGEVESVKILPPVDLMKSPTKKVMIYSDWGNNGFKTAKKAAEFFGPEAERGGWDIRPILVSKDQKKLTIPASAKAVIAITDSISHHIENVIKAGCERYKVSYHRAAARLEGTDNSLKSVLANIGVLEKEEDMANA